MRYDEDEKAIKEALETIKIPEHDFTQDIKDKINHNSLDISYKVVHKQYKKARLMLIVGIVGILSITVLGGTLTSFNRLLGIISPEIAAILRPISNDKENVDVSGMDNSNMVLKKAEGIEVRPLAVVNDNDMLLVYLTMQDLIEDRLDETMSIYDYFVEGTTINNCQVIDYDPVTKTAILRLQGNGGSKLERSSIQVVIKSFLSHKKELKALEINMDLSQISNLSQDDTTKLLKEESSGGGGSGDMWNEIEEKGYIEVLKVANKSIEVPGIRVMTISNIGFVDNKLHIQTKWDENDKDSHGYFYLVDQEGNKVEVAENNFYFSADERNNIQFGSNYVEYILDINPESIDGLKLMGYFVEWGKLVEGDWRVDVDLTSELQIMNLPYNLQMEDWCIEEIEVSPLGVTLIGEGKCKKQEELEASVKLKNGEVKTFDNIMTSNQFGKVTMKLGMEIPLAIDEITEIEINHHVININ